ncbi:hypothetical protein K3495_g9922 [Podosphaera aphanis]|nr:hypothetical protein K3495_g9922 [Podosphaera aphanis]
MANLSKRRKRDVRSSDDDDQPCTKAVRLKADLIISSPQSNEPKCLNSNRISRAKSYQRPTRVRASNVPSLQTHLTRNESDYNDEEIFTTPEKSNLEKIGEDRSRNRNIASFISRQAQPKPLKYINQIPIRTISNSQTSSSIDNEMISDWEEDDLEFMTQPSSFIKQATKKRADIESAFGLRGSNKEISSGSQKFLQKPTLAPVKAANNKDTRPWAERFAPTCLEELAVHKRKVADTRKWLEEVMSGRLKQRLLVLKGAAGTGKTTTLRLIATSMNCEVLEWRNPSRSVASSDGLLSMSAQFEEFLGRGARYGQLELISTHETFTGKREKNRSNSPRKIILIEEFPNTFTSSSTSLEYFRSSLSQYLTSSLTYASNNSQETSSKLIIPIVLIVSETLLTTSTASADSFTAHRLLGPTLLQHPGVGVIGFNPIAPTLLAKALQVILQKEARSSGEKKVPGPSLLKKFGEVGDIRSAVGCLEFLCLHGFTDGALSAKLPFSKDTKGRNSVEQKPIEIGNLDLITRREASLGIFHAVAKVVYNRRDEQASKVLVNNDAEKLPNYMSHHSRPKRSIVSVNELVDETGTDTQTFIAALHENYLLSCEAAPSCFEFSSLDHVNGSIDALSDSDLLGTSWHDFSNWNKVGNTGESNFRNEISFQVAVRGILFSLPHPVTRIPPAAAGLRMGKVREAHYMFYPTSLKLWKMKEENESIIDICVKHHLKEHLWQTSVSTGAASLIKSKSGKIEKQNSTTLRSNDSNTRIGSLLSTGNSARKEMLLERLPYMAQIIKSRRGEYSNAMKKNIEKVTTFTGIGRSEDLHENYPTTENIGENWATDEPDDKKRGRKQTIALEVNSTTGGLAIMQSREKLVLSDDDIEDD